MRYCICYSTRMILENIENNHMQMFVHRIYFIFIIIVNNIFNYAYAPSNPAGFCSLIKV